MDEYFVRINEEGVTNATFFCGPVIYRFRFDSCDLFTEVVSHVICPGDTGVVRVDVSTLHSNFNWN